MKKVKQMSAAEQSVDRQSESDASSKQRGRSIDGFAGFVQIEAMSAREIGGNQREDPPKHGTLTVYYAAGLGVMFLLFSVTAAGTARNPAANARLRYPHVHDSFGQLALLRLAGVRSGDADVRVGSHHFWAQSLDGQSSDGLPLDDCHNGVGGRDPPEPFATSWALLKSIT